MSLKNSLIGISKSFKLVTLVIMPTVQGCGSAWMKNILIERFRKSREIQSKGLWKRPAAHISKRVLLLSTTAHVLKYLNLL